MPDIIRTVILTTDPVLLDQIQELLTLTTFETISISETNLLAEIVSKHVPELLIVDLRGIHTQILSDPTISNSSISSRPIIFIDDTKKHILDSFHFLTMDFIILPLVESGLLRALKKARKVVSINPNVSRAYSASSMPLLHPKKSIDKLAIRNAGKIHFIPTAEIIFIEASGYYLQITTSAKKVLLRESMGQILKRLPPITFVRIHRSTIINLAHMQEINKINSREVQITMKNGKQLRVSNTYKKSLFHQLNL